MRVGSMPALFGTVAATAALAACGGSDDSGGTGTSNPARPRAS